jgi:hypothetical protein
MRCRNASRGRENLGSHAAQSGHVPKIAAAIGRWYFKKPVGDENERFTGCV